MGEALEVTAGGGPKRYDPNVSGGHHHLACVSCGDLRDVQPAGHESLRLPPRQRYGFALVDVEIVFRGLCPACKARSET